MTATMSSAYIVMALVAAIVGILLNQSTCHAFAPSRPSLTGRIKNGVEKQRSGIYLAESNDENINNVEDTETRKAPTRREAIQSAVSAATFLASSTPQPSQAIDTPDFLLPASRQSSGLTGEAAYKQARRATAYQVDSTIPPTLVPFRASREAAILKQLGQGSGTSKEPYNEDRLNLNNMAQKGIYGTVDLVKRVTGNKKEAAGSGKKDATFVFMGVDYASGDDAELAAGLLTDIVKPRARGGDATALGLEFCPQSTQGALDAYSKNGDEAALIDALAGAGVDRTTIDNYLPLLKFGLSKKLTLLALSPEVEDLRVVRSEGLQNVNLERRQKYVADAEGFIALTQDPKYKLYADKSLFKDFVPQSEKDTAGDFFAERILVHEAIATAAAKWAMDMPDSLVTVVAPIQDVRFLRGPNGRVPRICRFLNPLAKIDEEAVTTILLNPSAEETLSKSNFLRLEIGTTPQTLKYQTKIADYLWFSRMPKVNLLPRMMNYR